MNKPVVSVLMITYNHEKFISEAIEGVLMQKATFPIELIIGEDCSTDSTRKIVEEYAEKHPDIIRLLLPESNLGMMKNFIKTMEAAKGKYIALCEGDDYWTDPYKLQKQVDFLEANEEYSMCFGNASVYNETEKKIMFNQPGITENKTYTINDFFISNPCPTASVLFKREYIISLPEWFSKSPFGDYTLYLILLSISGKSAYYYKDTLCVYRIHSGGVHGNAHLSTKGMIKAYKQHLLFWKVIKENLFKYEYQKEINFTVGADYKLLIDYLLQDKDFYEAFKYNIMLMMHSGFKSFNYNLKTYKKILKLILKK